MRKGYRYNARATFSYYNKQANFAFGMETAKNGLRYVGDLSKRVGNKMSGLIGQGGQAIQNLGASAGDAVMGVGNAVSNNKDTIRNVGLGAGALGAAGVGGLMLANNRRDQQRMM